MVKAKVSVRPKTELFLRRPIEPKRPEKDVDGEESVPLTGAMRLKWAVEQLAGIDIEDMYFHIELDQYDDSYCFSLCGRRKKTNENYEREMKRYERMKKKYDVEMARWQEWNGVQQQKQLELQITSLKKRLKELESLRSDT